MDRLEAWKIQIMNKPVSDEIAKIKGLTMSGETEEKFESWRNEWDEIITLYLPEIEEKLFDVEEAANKYKFGKAKKLAEQITSELKAIEDTINLITDEINYLIHSEEQNRTKVEEVRLLYKETKDYFLTNEGSLGSVALFFEKRLKKISTGFEQFEDATQEGNYFEASEILRLMSEELNEEKSKMGVVPALLIQVQNDLPSQLDELTNGIEEMENEGYRLDHFSYKKDIYMLKKKIANLLTIIEEGNVGSITIPIRDIQEEIDKIYEALEHEVLSKQEVEYELPALVEKMNQLNTRLSELKEEVEVVKLSYRISSEEMKTQVKLEKQIKDLYYKLKVIEELHENNKQSYTAIKTMIDDLNIEYVDTKESLDHCINNLNSLRKDELKAKETIKNLKARIIQCNRLIKKSNIPGLPETLLNKIEEAESNLVIAKNKLDEIPIVMNEVNQSMNGALQSVEGIYEKITATIEQALMAEKVIQYGNRFRSRYSFIHEELLIAEEAFRHYDYEVALDISLKAITQVDPNALSYINTYYEQNYN